MTSDPRRSNANLWQILLLEDECAEIQRRRDRLVETLTKLEKKMAEVEGQRGNEEPNKDVVKGV